MPLIGNLYDDRIDKTVDFGVKVSVTCSIHTTKRWSTKNISHIGARTLFYDGDLAHDDHDRLDCMNRNTYPDRVLQSKGWPQEECFRESSVWPCSGHLILVSELSA